MARNLPGPTLSECNRTLLETENGLFETKYEQIPWHTGKKLWHRVFKNCYSNLREYWEDVSTKHAEREYIVYEDPFTKIEDRLTYTQSAELVKLLANTLNKEYGVVKGDRVAIAARNYPEYIIAYWAALSLGAVPAPINAWLVTDELAYCVTLSDPKVVLIDPERYDRLLPRMPELKKAGVKEFILLRSKSLTVPRKEPWREVKMLEEVLKKYDTRQNREYLAPVVIHPEDDATIMFTSGTTGRPKGALGSHRNYITNQWIAMFGGVRSAMRSAVPIPPMPLGPNDPQPITLLVVPLFHTTATSILGGVTIQGGKLVLAYKFEAGDALRIIEKEKVTSMTAVPAIIMMLVEHPDAKNGKRDLSSFISSSYGGAPAHPELAVNFAKTFKGSPGTAWGMTEASPVATSISGEDYLAFPDSAGVAHPLNEVICVDPDSLKEIPKGDVGELWIRGVNIIKGYWRNPEATKGAFLENGFYRTGDVGYIDPMTDFVYIKDRIKDMLIRGGENIYCQEIEDAIFTHPGVLDCTIVGVPHRVLGEEPAAVIVPKPSHPNLTQEDIISHLRPRIGAFKIPVFVRIQTEEIPRNPNGKVMKGIFKKDVTKLWEEEQKKRGIAKL